MKKYLVILIISLLYGCDSDETSEIIGDSISNFDLKVTEIDLTSASITWEKAIATDGSKVSYDIYLNDKVDLNYKLINSEQTSNSYSFIDLKSGTDYFVKVIAKNSSDLVTTQMTTFTTVPNLIPGKFTVTVENVDATSATLNWTKATDPEGKEVTYDIYLNNDLVKQNLNELTCKLTELESNKKYIIKVTAKDADGFKRESLGEFTTLQNFPVRGSYSQDDNGSLTKLGNLSSGSIEYYGKSGSKLEFDVYFDDEETGSRFYFYVATTNLDYDFEEHEFVLNSDSYDIIEASYKNKAVTYPNRNFASVRLTLRRNSENSYSASFVFDNYIMGNEPIKENSDLVGTYEGDLQFIDQS